MRAIKSGFSRSRCDGSGMSLFPYISDSCLNDQHTDEGQLVNTTPESILLLITVSCSLLFLLLHILQREADGAVNTMPHLPGSSTIMYTQSPFLTALVSLLHPVLFNFSHRSPPRYRSSWHHCTALILWLLIKLYPWTETSYQEQPSLMFIRHLYVAAIVMVLCWRSASPGWETSW